MTQSLRGFAVVSALLLALGCGAESTKDTSTSSTSSTSTSTSTGTGSATGTGTGMGSGTGGMGQPHAMHLCHTLEDACTGDNQQFTDATACIDYVENWSVMAVGADGDTSGNTIGCRSYHADAAGADPAAHCDHAGASGGDVCGSWCDNYCDLAITNCGGANELFADRASCMTECAAIPNAGEANATSGDSVQCRIYHLGVAGSDVTGGSADDHCAHGSVIATGPCL